MDDAISEDIRFRARQWTIDLHAPDASDSARRACDAWRAEHAQHETAFRDAQRVWAMLGDVAHADAAAPPSRPAIEGFFAGSRRAAHITWAARLAAALAVLAVGAWYLITPPGGITTLFADVRTAPGELRTVTLEDGTVVRLNGATGLSYRLDPYRREIKLIAGEAHFSVAHDSSRPMFVEAADARIRVTGTRFDVRLANDKTILTLEEGSVEASRAGSSPVARGPDAVRGSPPVRVHPGEQVIWQAGTNLEPIPSDVSEALAWQRGRLIFKSRPLGEVIDELARYRRGQTFVIGAAASELVTGVFPASDPEAVLSAVERTLDIHVVRVTPLVTIIF